MEIGRNGLEIAVRRARENPDLHPGSVCTGCGGSRQPLLEKVGGRGREGRRDVLHIQAVFNYSERAKKMLKKKHTKQPGLLNNSDLLKDLEKLMTTHKS